MQPPAFQPGTTLTCFLSLLLLVAGCQQPAASSSAGDSCDSLQKTPVLFIHGSGLSADSWDSMRAAFRQAGYPAALLHAVSMQPDDGDNIVAASKFVEPAVAALIAAQEALNATAECARTPVGKVDIVAHSMGAVSGRWFASRIAPERVRRLLTIAGANHGSNALCGLQGRGNQQLCPAFADASTATDSVQTRLNGSPQQPLDETPYGVGRDSAGRRRIPPDQARQILYATLRLQPDEWIVPASSALLDGAGGPELPALPMLPVTETSPGNYLFRDSCSHDDLVRHPAAIQWVLAMLDSPPSASIEAEPR